MPHNHEWQTRIKKIEREYIAMRQACDLFLKAAQEDPTILRSDLRPREIGEASDKLEGTYLMRLFAEFESGARQCWEANWGTEPRTIDLLNGLAARFKIPDDQRDWAHKVRDYRNGLVHERDKEILDRMKTDLGSFSDIRHYLCHFFSFLPPHW